MINYLYRHMGLTAMLAIGLTPLLLSSVAQAQAPVVRVDDSGRFVLLSERQPTGSASRADVRLAQTLGQNQPFPPADQPPGLPGQPPSDQAPPSQTPPGEAPPDGSSALADQASNPFDQTRPAGDGIGWLSNVVVSGVRTYVDVSPAGAGVNAALAGSREDAASLFKDVLGVALEQRGNGQNDTILLGRRLGQNNLRGSYWFPARQDLDTLLSKIDSSLVDEIIAIRGPYSTLYGPGLAFYDLHLLKAPRSEEGFQSFGSTSLDYETNGERFYGRQSVWGGDSDWGFRVGYGHRTGNDYETADDRLMPASEKSRFLDIALGADLTTNSHVDFTYLRLDQTDVEYPGQVFDLNFLVTDAYELTYTLEDQPLYDLLTVEGWYNQTRFAGDNLRPSKRRQIPQLDTGFPGGLRSTTDADAMSTGYRAAALWGDQAGEHLTAGADLRFLKQGLNEFNQFGNGPPLPSRIPRSHSINPGLFLEGSLPVTDQLTVRSGVRTDWVSMNAETSPARELLLVGEFDQHFVLWSAFFTADYQVDRHWTITSAFGHSMRPPTMTEMYALGPFVAALPQFAFTRLYGNPELNSERMWQTDLSLSGKFEKTQLGVTGFHSWVNDYITLDLLNPPDGVIFGYANADLATLAGVEAFVQYDVNSCLTAYGTGSFVEGRNQRRRSVRAIVRDSPLVGALIGNSAPDRPIPKEEPLPAIPPLESRLGLILHQPCPEPVWSVEFAARVVDNQDRVARSLREEPTPGFTTYEIRGYWRPSDQIVLTAGVENLTNKLYKEHLDTHIFAEVFQPGVTFYFGTEVTY